MNLNPQDFITDFLVNTVISRAGMRSQLLDGKFETRDIDAECGYPVEPTIDEYKAMYERNDIAKRVVDLEPNECWKEYPEIYETEEERETDFEKAVDLVLDRTHLYSYLARVDRVSGIGRYGVLFLGLDDGNELDTPAPGYDEHQALDKPGDAEILYYRVFDERGIGIAQVEQDPTNIRYGLPLYYNLVFADVSATTGSVPEPSTIKVGINCKVHWSRVVHIADNLTTSEIYGSPRMKDVYNRLYDLRKINGGAGEMFWKGGFPGLSFEVDPKAGEFGADERAALREEIRLYAEGLQRYLTMVGVSVKSIAPQLSDPSPFVENILRIIASTKGIPIRLFTGTEVGATSGKEESNTWNERVALRRDMYVTPHIIRPVIDRLIQVGALPTPVTEITASKQKAPQYSVKWKPLAKLTATEIAEVGKNLTEALARYSTAGGEALIPLPEFLGKFLGFSFQQVEAIMKAPPTKMSVVIQELAAGLAGGNTGAAGGNMPTSIPNMAKKKDPGKTPQNVVQRKKGTKAVPRKTVSKNTPSETQ